MFDPYRDLFLIHSFNFYLRGTLGFSVLAIFRSVFRFLCQKTAVFFVLEFIAVCGFSVF